MFFLVLYRESTTTTLIHILSIYTNITAIQQTDVKRNIQIFFRWLRQNYPSLPFSGMVWAMFAMIFVRQCGSHTCCYSSKRYSQYPLLPGFWILLQVVGASRSDAAVLMLVGQFADGISTTLLGLVADKLGRVPIFRWGMWDLAVTSISTSFCCCRKYGKRKSLHLVGSLCVLLSFPFIFSLPLAQTCG